MKKIFCLLIGIVLLSCSCSKSETTSGYASNRHQYDKETRIEQNTEPFPKKRTRKSEKKRNES